MNEVSKNSLEKNLKNVNNNNNNNNNYYYYYYYYYYIQIEKITGETEFLSWYETKLSLYQKADSALT